MTYEAYERLYHVPRSQVWAGSGGRQQGRVHLHVPMSAGEAGTAVRIVGRIVRAPGGALCGRRGWYERPPDTDRERSDDMLCPRCVEIAARVERSEAGAVDEVPVEPDCERCGGPCEVPGPYAPSKAGASAPDRSITGGGDH